MEMVVTHYTWLKNTNLLIGMLQWAQQAYVLVCREVPAKSVV